MGKAAIRITDIIDDQEKVKQKLLEPGFKLISALCDHLDVEKAESFSRSVVLLFDFHGRSFDLLRFALGREVRATVDAKQIFREDRIYFRILSHFMQFAAADWLRYILSPVIQKMNPTESYEIQTKLPKDRKVNLRRLRKVAHTIVESLAKNAISAPNKLCVLFNLVSQEVSQAFPDHKMVALSALMFLRLVCPALCSPEIYGLVEGTLIISSQCRTTFSDCRQGIDFGGQSAANPFPQHEVWHKRLQRIGRLHFESLSNPPKILLLPHVSLTQPLHHARSQSVPQRK